MDRVNMTSSWEKFLKENKKLDCGHRLVFKRREDEVRVISIRDYRKGQIKKIYEIRYN